MLVWPLGRSRRDRGAKTLCPGRCAPHRTHNSAFWFSFAPFLDPRQISTEKSEEKRQSEGGRFFVRSGLFRRRGGGGKASLLPSHLVGKGEFTLNVQFLQVSSGGLLRLNFTSPRRRRRTRLSLPPPASDAR